MGEGRFKIKCISGSDLITEGKTYDVINGYFSMDNGELSHQYFTVGQINRNFVAVFELVKEDIKPTLSSFTDEELITELFNRIKN